MGFFCHVFSNPKQSRQQLHFIVENSANFYCPQKDIHLEGTQTLTGIFVHNNGLTRQRTFGNRVARRGDRCSMRPWSENPSLRRV